VASTLHRSGRTVDANSELRRVIPPPVPVETDEQWWAREQKGIDDAAAAEEAARKALFAEWEKPVGNENRLQRVQRVAALKEAYWRNRLRWNRGRCRPRVPCSAGFFQV